MFEATDDRLREAPPPWVCLRDGVAQADAQAVVLNYVKPGALRRRLGDFRRDRPVFRILQLSAGASSDCGIGNVLTEAEPLP